MDDLLAKELVFSFFHMYMHETCWKVWNGSGSDTQNVFVIPGFFFRAVNRLKKINWLIAHFEIRD